MLTSHEKMWISFFFTELVAIYKKVNIEFKPNYIMIDTCHAMAYSIRIFFPNCKILMCWFHSKKKCQKAQGKNSIAVLR